MASGLTAFFCFAAFAGFLCDRLPKEKQTSGGQNTSDQKNHSPTFSTVKVWWLKTWRDGFAS